jgi:predicted ABC-class ATPase
MSGDRESLKTTLLELDGRNYITYRDIKGIYQFSEFTLIIDHVQGDPFASPTKIIVKVPHAIAGFANSLYNTPIRSLALRDFLVRRFEEKSKELSAFRGTGRSGLISIIRTGPEILERTAILLNSEGLEVRFLVGLPAKGRTILGRQAAMMLCEDVPEIVKDTLKYSSLNPQHLQQHLETAEDADWLRAQLEARGLVAFVANGSILPRRSGVDSHPLVDEAIPFQSPASLQREFTCPHRGMVKGMGIPKGITLIVGGGYHGKSTLLRALELGVYNHIPGDGRELVVTNGTAVKIRAEDGRSVAGVNISPFINQLPQARSTVNFSTTNASGSTSQAANIIEALEVGSQVLLLDEDTCATNFMIRDRRMQQLIAKDKEPITPLIDKVGQLYDDYGVSTILVIGGSGDYFEVANLVIAMDNFQPQDVTPQAKAIALQHLNHRLLEGGSQFGTLTPRIPLPETIDPSRGDRAVKVKVKDTDAVGFGQEEIDLAAVEQIVDTGQLRAIAAALVYAKNQYLDRKRTIQEILGLVMGDIENQGLDILTEYPQGDLVMFRSLELACALNRLRSLKVLARKFS